MQNGQRAMKDTILSLADVTGGMVAPWINAGYKAVLVDPQHPIGIWDDEPNITTVGYVLDHPKTWKYLRQIAPRICFTSSFPVCTDLAISGTSRWSSKGSADYYFQVKAMQLVHECRVVGEMIGAPWFFENPISAISTIYRKWDYKFSPNEFGGYLPEDDVHPLYPEYYPPRDAYRKPTCLWSGCGFKLPQKKPVEIEESQTEGQGSSAAHNKLGGKSDRTKNIRSATPRGFAQAVFELYGEL